MVENDKRRILERRALFISSSLALLSCGPKPPPDTPVGTSPEITVPADDAAAPKEDLVTTAPPERPETPPEAPVLEIPDGVSERTRTNYERMFKTVRSQLATIEAAAKKAPAACDVSQKNCEAEFRAVADALLDYHQSSRFSYFCPGSSDEAIAFHKTKSHLMRDVQARHSELVQRLEQALSEGGADGKKEWARIEQEAAAARPHPCLSFACEDW